MFLHIIPRSVAKEIGLKRYFTGDPCPKGHLAERQVSSRACILCVRQYKSKNKEKIKESGRAYYIKNKERILSKQKDFYKEKKDAFLLKCREYRERNKEKRSETLRKYYDKNKEVILKYSSEYRSKRKEHYKELGAAWRKENQGVCRAYVRNRRAKIKGAKGSHTKEDINSIKIKQKHKCANCGKCLKNSCYHVDHIYPIAKGGTNNPDNLQILCPGCNHRKSAKDPIVWANENGRLL